MPMGMAVVRLHCYGAFSEACMDPEYGEITVLGVEPGIRSSHVPGKDVGYMPQVTSYFHKNSYSYYIAIL